MPLKDDQKIQGSADRISPSSSSSTPAHEDVPPPATHLLREPVTGSWDRGGRSSRWTPHHVVQTRRNGVTDTCDVHRAGQGDTLEAFFPRIPLTLGTHLKNQNAGDESHATVRFELCLWGLSQALGAWATTPQGGICLLPSILCGHVLGDHSRGVGPIAL